MDPLFATIDSYLDPNPARRILWSTHDESQVNFADMTKPVRLVEHMRAALQYRPISGGILALYYGGEGESRTHPLTSVLATSRLPSSVHIGLQLNAAKEFVHEGETVIAAHIGFKDGRYGLDSLEVDVQRCAKLGFALHADVVSAHQREHYRNHFWIPAASLTTLDKILDTKLCQPLDSPVNAVLAMHGLYHLAK